MSDTARGPRILVVFGNIPYGGNERSQIAALNLLHKAGAEILCVVHERWGETIATEAKRIGCATVPALFPPRPRFTANPVFWGTLTKRYIATTRRILKAAAAFKPTHLHLTDTTNLFWAAAAIRRLRLPVSVKVPAAVPPNAPRRTRFIWKRLIPRFADRFAVTSRFMARHLEELGIPPEKIVVVPNPVIVRPAAPPDGPWTQWPPDRRRIIYIGRIAAFKGVDLLTEVAERLVKERADVDVVLAGDYTWKNPFADKLRRRVAAAGLEERIVFLGEISWVPEALRRCHIHVMPSVCEEAFGNVILEAKAAGIPSVVFPRGGMPELVEHEKTGLICREATAAALAEALRRYLGDEELRRAHGKRARTSANDYAPEKIAPLWLSFFRELPMLPDKCNRPATPANSER